MMGSLSAPLFIQPSAGSGERTFLPSLGQRLWDEGLTNAAWKRELCVTFRFPPSHDGTARALRFQR